MSHRIRSVMRGPEKIRDLLLMFLIVSFPFSGFVPFSVGSVGIKYSWLGGALLTAYGFIRIASNRRIRWNISVLFIGLWVVWALFTGVVPVSTGEIAYIREYLFGAVRLVFFFTLVVALMNIDIGKETLIHVFQLTVIVALFVSIYAVYQFFARQYGLPFGYLQLSNPSLVTSHQVGGTYYTKGVFARVSSTFAEPSWLGTYLVDILFLLGVPLVRQTDESLLFDDRRINLAIFAVCMLGFVLAYSLGAYAVFGVVFLLFLVTEKNIIDTFHVAAPATVLFLLFDILTEAGRITVVIIRRVLVLFGHLIPDFERSQPSPDSSEPQSNTTTSQKYSSNTTSADSSPHSSAEGGPTPLARSSLDARLQRIESGIEVWTHHPIVGVGLNNYQFYSEHGSNYVGTDFGWTFNYFQTLAEQGIVGLVLLLTAIVYPIQKLLLVSQSYFDQDDADRGTILRVFFYILVADAIAAFFVNQIYFVRFWFYIGLGLAALMIGGKYRETELPV